MAFICHVFEFINLFTKLKVYYIIKLGDKMANYKIQYYDGLKGKILQVQNNIDFVGKLYEIDNITSQIPNEESFINYLKLMNKGINVDSAKLVYGSENNKREKEIIYNNELIFKVTEVCKKSKSNEVDFELIKPIIEKIKNYVLVDEKIFEYDLDFPLRLKMLLENYRLYYIKRLNDDLNQVAFEIKKELKDYTKFREVILWIKKYQIIKNNELEELVSSISHEKMEFEKKEETKKMPEYNQMTLEEYAEIRNIENFSVENNTKQRIYAGPSYYDEDSHISKEEKWLLEATKNIEDEIAKEIFLKTGDPEAVLYTLGEEKAYSLSDNDKKIIFGLNYETFFEHNFPSR